MDYYRKLVKVLAHSDDICEDGIEAWNTIVNMDDGEAEDNINTCKCK